MTKQAHLSPPDKDEIRELIGHDVYVSGDMAEKDAKECRRIWADFVRSQTDGRYTGQIQGYDNHNEYGGVHVVGPDGDMDPGFGADLRTTWTLCVLNKKGKVVGWKTFLPGTKSADDSTYEFDDELADEVVKGTITLAQAKKRSQWFSEHIASSELEEEIEAGYFDDTIPA